MNKKNQNITSEIWDGYYKNSEFNDKWFGNQYPNEELIIFVSNQRKNVFDKIKYFDDLKKDYSIKTNFNGNVLEFGFGGLANLIMLKDKGYNCFGLEVSKTSIIQAKQYLKKNNVSNIDCKLWKPDSKIPFQNKKFKLIVGLQCIYYNLKLNNIIENIYERLEDNGQFMFSFFSNKHEYNKYVDEVDKKKNLVKWSNNHPSIRIRGATLYQPKTENDLKSLFYRFKDLRVFTSESNSRPIFQSWWYITGRK
jgi:SAM-dependent methyltransferase|tara:strand:- start:12113 stop:12865 length:753 start_codon:yes stop_codon:yes gene_type:complete